ncbi:hypothetical protein [Criblamydia sequanensis]|uniref:Uncharacterized protein n=1 Tax=Candidatus Criblamydia sequanensis CRIB-18 TaxID=1437425 RepID=A0A090DVF5_9BACT|nr:hypothetical protein [Criblamydia sequanensis]CDR32974.1 hypothetical protein CSEC_0134 [Criblamydia sequanensis CRIB-18]
MSCEVQKYITASPRTPSLFERFMEINRGEKNTLKRKKAWEECLELSEEVASYSTTIFLGLGTITFFCLKKFPKTALLLNLLFLIPALLFRDVEIVSAKAQEILKATHQKISTPQELAAKLLEDTWFMNKFFTNLLIRQLNKRTFSL